MTGRWILNPCDEFVEVLKYDIKNNNGYCTEVQEKNKTTKCPKRCKKNPQLCSCGMYVKAQIEE